MTDEERLALFRNKLKDLLDEYGHTFHQDTAEFFDGDGQWWASTIFDDKSPVWHVTGLIQHALENDFNDEEEEED